MIDVESAVFSKVQTALLQVCPEVCVVGEYVRCPPGFPCVSIMEVSNTENTSTMDTSGEENHAVVLYEVNVYSNLESGRKSQCRELTDVCDKVFRSIGFVRTMMSALPNMADASIYRMTARFRAIVDRDGRIYSAG